MSRPLGLILAGGQSKRLFPVETPKPLLKVGNRTLLQLAIERLAGFDVCVVCNAEIARKTEEVFSREGLPCPRFAIEPEGRDTAAAVGFGLSYVAMKDPEWVAVLSADHWMPQNEKFPDFLKTVGEEVRAHPESLFVGGSLQTTKPRESHSQFGWVVPKAARGAKSFEVKVFVEKPEGAKLNTARKSGGLINAGMFFGKRDVFLKAYEKLYPEVLDSKIPYSSLKRLPIDKAIFEKFENVRVVPLKLVWEDLGTWKDWFDLIGKGQGSGGVQVNSKNVLISSDPDTTVYSFGNQNLAIVQSGKKILVMPLSDSKDLKKYLEKLK